MRSWHRLPACDFTVRTFLTPQAGSLCHVFDVTFSPKPVSYDGGGRCRPRLVPDFPEELL